MRAIAITGFCYILIVTSAAAQTPDAPETREQALRQEREAKALALKPNKENALQRALATIEERGMFLAARDGLFPKIGSLATGSGFALGVGYRNRAVFNRYGTLEAFSAVSIRKYWALETRATFPDLARGHLFADTVASLREYPQEDFYGLGPDSARADETNYYLRTARVGGRGGVRLGPLTSVGATLDYLTPRVGAGHDRRSPTIAARFSPQDAPGLDGGHNFLRTALFAEFDYRQPKNARQGGYYRIERSHYADRSGDVYTFNRTDIDLRQYLGFLNGRRVIALRGVYATTDTDDGHAVPFYLMPWLGGKDTLRGFKNYRYRGPHSLLLQAEYRWEIWSALEGALFYDAGKVGLARRDLSLSHLEHAYGFGFRFNTDSAVVLRFDAAFGSRDGKRLHMNMGGVF